MNTDTKYAEQRVGQILAKYYRLDRVLAVGGMGVLYAGKHTQTQRAIAVKLLLPSVAERLDLVHRFRNEAKALAKLHHPNVVEVIHFGETDDGTSFMVMPLLSGESLEAKLQRGPLSCDETLAILRPVLRGLKAAHVQGLVHRDIKPANVFLSSDGVGGCVPKLLDFGIAKRQAETGSGHARPKTVGMWGTPGYMSPEQVLESGSVDVRTDVWAMGVLFYECLVGSPPFDLENEAAGAVLSKDPPQISKKCPALPAPIASIVDKAMQRDVNQRFQTIDEFEQALDRASADLAKQQLELATRTRVEPKIPPTIVSLPPPPLQPPLPLEPPRLDPPRKKSGFSVAALGAFAVGVGVGTGWLLGVRQKSEPPQPVSSSVLPNDSAVSPISAADAAIVVVANNSWVRVPAALMRTERRCSEYECTTVTRCVALGVANDNAPPSQLGFRPRRAQCAPDRPYEIQQHEVTWSELDSWLASRSGPYSRPSWVPPDPSRRARWPATGVSWTDASQYCRSLGPGTDLPTEAQWEYAGRGQERRRFPWGSDPLDNQRTRLYHEAEPVVAEVMTHEQDRTPTPGVGGLPIHDLLGNALEWTLSLYSLDTSGDPASNAWTQRGQLSYRTVRGLPPHWGASLPMPPEPMAWRKGMCATGDCPPDNAGENDRQYIGFRCARAVNDPTN